MKFIIILSLLALTAFAGSSEFRSLWSTWKTTHGRFYSAGEEEARFAIFVDNFHKIQKFNAENDDVKLGVNLFADLTAEEFKNQYSRCHNPREEKITEDTLEITSYPSSVDWRTKGAVTPIKNQGQCGSCWTFSATGAVEGFYFLKNGKLLSFSEQQIVDCAHSAGQGCEGGWEDKAIQYAGQKGLETESDYPYTAEDGTCKYNAQKAVKTNTGVTEVTPKSVDALKSAIATMPTSIAIEADQNVFQFYTSGVISKGCGASLDHAVLAVGYGTISGQDAFIVKNSWGTSWGDQGYVYISTLASPNGGVGVCGILSEPCVPK